MPILTQPRVITADVAKALEDYNGGDFEPAMRLLTAAPARDESIEVIRFPGAVEPMRWRISPDDLRWPPQGFRGLFAAWHMKQLVTQEWQRLQFMYEVPDLRRPTKNPRLKWGQPGRGRKRKMRLQTRRRQREIVALLAKVRALADGAILLPNSPQTASHPHLSLQHLRDPQQTTDR